MQDLPNGASACRLSVALPLHQQRQRIGMPSSEKVRSRIHMLEERLARLRSEKSRLLARAGQAERKRDTRRKILIGGAVLAAIEREGVPRMQSVEELLRWLDRRLSRSHDRAVFDLPAAAGRRPALFSPPRRRGGAQGPGGGCPASAKTRQLPLSGGAVKEAAQAPPKRRAASLTAA